MGCNMSRPRSYHNWIDNPTIEDKRWLDWVGFNESDFICIHFQNAERGIECTANNCPCDLYEPENVKE